MHPKRYTGVPLTIILSNTAIYHLLVYNEDNKNTLKNLYPRNLLERHSQQQFVVKKKKTIKFGRGHIYNVLVSIFYNFNPVRRQND